MTVMCQDAHRELSVEDVFLAWQRHGLSSRWCCCGLRRETRGTVCFSDLGGGAGIYRGDSALLCSDKRTVITGD